MIEGMIEGEFLRGEDVLLEVRDLYKDYVSVAGRVRVLMGVDLDLYRGEVVSIVGESGSGKSTLLNIIGGLDHGTGGGVKFMGESVEGMLEEEKERYRNQKVGYVFQHHYLLQDFSAIENVMMPYLAYRYRRKECELKAEELLEGLRMGGRMDRLPKELSGGEQQRVSIARALMNDPDMILADEPTGNLDERNGREVESLFFKLRERYGVSIIVVTHNVEVAGRSDRILRLERGKLKGEDLSVGGGGIGIG